MSNRIETRGKARLHGGTFWRNVIIVLSGTVAGQALSVATLPAISRLYSPEAFGQYAMLISASSLLTIVVGLGLSSAVMAPEADDAAELVVVIAFGCAVVLATGLVIVALALQQLAPWTAVGLPAWQVCVWVFLMAITGSLNALLRVYVNRRGFNRALAINSIVAAVSTLTIAVPFGFVADSSLGLIVAGLVASCLSSAQMLRHANPFRHRMSRVAVSETLRSYWQYVAYQYPANLMESASAQLPTQVLGGLYGSAQLGSYSMNERLFGVPLRVVGGPLSVVYFRHGSQAFRAGKGLAPLTFSIVSKVMLAAFGPMAILIYWGPNLFGWALGDQWREAGALAAYLAPLYVLSLGRASISNCRVVIGHQRTNAILSAVRLSIVGLAVFAGHAWLGSIVGTIFTLALGSSVFMLVDVATNFLLLRSHLKRFVLISVLFSLGVAFLWWHAGALAPLGC